MLKSLKENHKEFKISNKLIIKTQQKFKRERKYFLKKLIRFL